jgi:hypothetical protein
MQGLIKAFATKAVGDADPIISPNAIEHRDATTMVVTKRRNLRGSGFKPALQ